MTLHSLVTLALVAAACATGVQEPAGPAPRRVLFVGNSLTAGWSLPGLVAALAAASGDTIEVASVTLSGASLDDHLAHGGAERALRGASFDVVVFQQGPTSTPEGGDQLEAAMRRFAPLVRAAGARPALYMAWPTPDRRAFWDASAANYARAARAVDGLLLPAGSAVRHVVAQAPSAPILEADGFHLAPEGAWLAAATIVSVLTDRRPSVLPASVRWDGYVLDVPVERAAVYREAVRAALGP